MGNKMDYISTLIDLNILCLLDLVWWSHLFSPWWDLQKIILFTNLFSVSIWFTKCDDGGSNFASSLVASFLSSHVEACYCHAINVSWVVEFQTKGCKIIYISFTSNIMRSKMRQPYKSWKFQLPKTIFESGLIFDP